MHYLHFIVTKVNNGEEAVENAESYIGNWGDEGNWRQFGGAVSEDNEIYIVNNGKYGARWNPDEKTTIDSLNDLVREWLKPERDIQKIFATLALANRIDDAFAKDQKFNWMEVEDFARHAMELCYLDCKPDEFNILEHSFFPDVYDKNGVTHIYQDEDEGKKWVVFVDMHT